jgi:hypothetical protein
MQLDMRDRLEDQICDAIAQRKDDLVDLLRTLIRFDTTTHVSGAPPAKRQGCRHTSASVCDPPARQLRSPNLTRLWLPGIR